jgi:hypothetical protein
MLALAAGLILFIVVAPILGFFKQDNSSLRFTPVFVIAGIALGVIRVACFWALFYLDRTGQRETYDSVPFRLLIIPEGGLLLGIRKWTIVQGILLSALLAMGSFVWAAILGWSMRARKVS